MRAMKISALAICMLLAACGADQQTSEPQRQGGDSPTLSSPKSASKKPAKQADEIKAGLSEIEKKIAISRRYDRVRDLDGGAKQRQVFVEVLGASADEVAEHANGVFEGRGFKVKKGKNDFQGIRLQYSKGKAKVNVLVRSKDASPTLKDPKATASLYFRQDQP